MKVSFKHIASAVDGTLYGEYPHQFIEAVSIDTRTVVTHNNTLFIALIGEHFDAHAFLSKAYEKGIRFFIVSDKKFCSEQPDVNYILVSDTRRALQSFASWYRKQFDFPIIGITGSNGKTIVKEWLAQLLQNKEQIVMSPRSYNSQIGVPLSILQIEEKHSLGIFEAGISEKNEMDQLEKIINPTIGILTNIGQAHDAGFAHRAEKFFEKMKLFQHAQKIILSSKTFQKYSSKKLNFFSWGYEEWDDVRIISIQKLVDHSKIFLLYQGNQLQFDIPFTDDASIENILHCINFLLYREMNAAQIQEGIHQLRSIPMRLSVKKIGNDAILVDDTYSADFGSLKIALDYLVSLENNQNISLVISDFKQTGMSTPEWIKQIFNILEHYPIKRMIAIGKEWFNHKEVIPTHHIEDLLVFEEVNEATLYLKNSIQNKELILLKGARNYALDRIVKALEIQSHETRIEVMIPNLIENIQYFKKNLNPGVRLMGMVKAFSYGTGSYEIAKTLIQQGADYLAVAYLDEGVELRRKGIKTPIMVMNVETHSFERLIEYQLEPVIYSKSIWGSLLEFLKSENIESYPIHIELETGMNRLGMSLDDLLFLQGSFNHPAIKIISVFSHLVGSEDPVHDEFTLQQFELFQKMQAFIAQELPYRFLQHILNSNGILRHPSLQMDMVRLGIGMYGLASNTNNKHVLKPVVSFMTSIAQIKELEAGNTVSYGRKTKLQAKSKIATLRVGYADGYPRALGNGIGEVWINGHRANVVGTVCMDMLMVDITHIESVKEGDLVELWGENISIEKLSEQCNTIPYEILTGVNSRVKRVYITG